MSPFRTDERPADEPATDSRDVETFQDDDAGYRSWLWSHQADGYVVNAQRREPGRTDPASRDLRHDHPVSRPGVDEGLHQGLLDQAVRAGHPGAIVRPTPHAVRLLRPVAADLFLTRPPPTPHQYTARGANACSRSRRSMVDRGADWSDASFRRPPGRTARPNPTPRRMGLQCVGVPGLSNRNLPPHPRILRVALAGHRIRAPTSTTHNSRMRSSTGRTSEGRTSTTPTSQTPTCREQISVAPTSTERR
jgi:hypothetical protein